MPAYEVTLIRTDGLEIQWESTDLMYLKLFEERFPVEYHAGKAVELDSSIPNWITLSGFANVKEMVKCAAWVMDRLDKDGWGHDNYEDAMCPETHHYKRQVESKE